MAAEPHLLKKWLQYFSKKKVSISVVMAKLSFVLVIIVPAAQFYPIKLDILDKQAFWRHRKLL